jgi:hypothetical protein
MPPRPRRLSDSWLLPRNRPKGEERPRRPRALAKLPDGSACGPVAVPDFKLGEAHYARLRGSTPRPSAIVSPLVFSDGSVAAYLEAALGLTAADQDRLRALYTES